MEFMCDTRIVMGTGTISALKELQIKRLLLVTDPYFVKTGKAQQVLEAAGAVENRVFDRVEPDPSVALAAEGTALVKEFKPEVLVALGGGSAMDCAKAMAYFSGGVRLVAIPTTSGSGSEVTDFAILTHGGVKHPLVDKRLRPDMAIVDSHLVAKLPPALVADGGFDVLTHCAEAYVATGGGPFSQALAADAFRTVLQGLRDSYSGNLTARGAIHTAATMAGLAFTQAGLGLCHSLSHALGGRFHIPHGRLNAILLPAVMSRTPATAYACLARKAGVEGVSDTIGARNLRTALVGLRKAVGLPATLAQAGVAPAQVRNALPELVETAMADPCSRTHPVPVTADLVREVLREVMGNG